MGIGIGIGIWVGSFGFLTVSFELLDTFFFFIVGSNEGDYRACLIPSVMLRPDSTQLSRSLN